jgi:serine/threonine-protein kinase
VGIPRIEHVGRYELLIELAKGGMAELYLGRLHGVGGFAKLVAIKRILPHLAEDKLFVEMFLNEGRIAAHLSHPNVCQVHELGEADGSLFLAMEYLDGVSWDALIRDQPRTPPANEMTLRLVAGVIAQASEGLHYAHELRDHDGTPTPVIHRDVSPQNLFVTVDGACKVLDFGVSKMHKDGPRTRTGVLKGKLPYMSPEQIQGEQVDARSDVFALGVVVWEALAGRSLFDRDTDFLIWKAITEAEIPLLASRGYPPEIDAVLGAALARDRGKRFRTARAFGEALRHAAGTVGGAYDADEIAGALKAACGARITERSREVASVVAKRLARTSDEPTAGDTLEDKAGSTVSLRSGDQADSTVSLRSRPVRVLRESARDLDSAQSLGDSIDRPATRRRWPFVIGSLALIGSIVAVIAMTRGDDAAPASPQPVAATPVTPPAGIEALEQLRDMKPKLEQLRDSLQSLSGPTDGSGAEPEVATKPAPATKVGKTVKAPPTKVVAGTGAYSVDSSPYATIYIDGKRVDTTPLHHKLAAGKHTVKAVRSDDGREKTFSIQVAPGKTFNSGKLTW